MVACSSRKFLKKFFAVLGVSSTTPSDNEGEFNSEEDFKPFEDVREALESSRNDKLSFDRVKESYDTLIELYPGEMHVNGEEISEFESGVHPSRESYHVADTDALDFLNKYSQGDTLMLAFGFSASPEYGEGVPTYREMRERDLKKEGNWWDNLDEVEADILLDRDSFFGTVYVHEAPEVFDLAYNDGAQQVYLLESS